MKDPKKQPKRVEVQRPPPPEQVHRASIPADAIIARTPEGRVFHDALRTILDVPPAVTVRL